MKWSPEADNAVRKAPFFVRKKVRAAVEEYVRKEGRRTVEQADVTAAKKQYLADMSRDIKGYQVDTCFGSAGCPRRANPGDDLMGQVQEILDKADLLSFLKETVTGPLRYHHEFRVALADCPNACSQPQIKDMGLIGAVRPGRGQAECSMCGECYDNCPERAITLDEHSGGPEIDYDRCLSCGQCLRVCPTGTLIEIERGFRVQLGGRLGRHPRLGLEIPGLLPGLLNEKQVLAVLRECLDFYKQNCRQGQRFAKTIGPDEVKRIAAAVING